MHIKTPCIGICSTVYGDLVCMGCYRFHHEIINWNHYTEQQKASIWSRLIAIITQVISETVIICDTQRLHKLLQDHNIRFQEHLPPEHWVYSTFNQYSKINRPLAELGITKHYDYIDLEESMFIDLIQKEILTRSQAQYDHKIKKAYQHIGFVKSEV